MRTIWILGPLTAALIVAACVPRPAPPAPAPPPQPAPQPVPPPEPAAPPQLGWEDAPLSRGDWIYRQDGAVALASFRSERATFVLRCDHTGAVTLAIIGAQAPAFVLRTSYGERRVPATPVHFNEMLATISATDPLLDQLVFSRGRFLVEAEGGTALVVPAWPEPARVIEECRT
jgi:hypothetical protein